jgi:hypothetical protein
MINVYRLRCQAQLIPKYAIEEDGHSHIIVIKLSLWAFENIVIKLAGAPALE